MFFSISKMCLMIWWAHQHQQRENCWKSWKREWRRGWIVHTCGKTTWRVENVNSNSNFSKQFCSAREYLFAFLCECWWNEVWLHDKLNESSHVLCLDFKNATWMYACKFSLEKIIKKMCDEIHEKSSIWKATKFYVCNSDADVFRFLVLSLCLFCLKTMSERSSLMLRRSSHALMQIDAKICCNLIISAEP